ncbi:MAG TPA: TSUP family transporter [Pseudogracilibacillus sp.]|nr:TSUP family transporter [Pseudogracilibacillus sp.]
MSTLLILFVTGLAVGFINVISAGGSLLSLPILIFLGLPSSVANGTNRIAILVQNITAFLSFLRKGLVKWKL